jgi:hypothetical protein
MGYYIDLTEAEWEISESPEALATIREMPTKYHAIKRGGSSNGEKWFSWMNDTEIETTDTVENVFNQLGFETDKVDGGFQLTAYNSKTGQEDLFLAVMAPFTKDGSYVEWRGEDGALWRYEIRDGRMFRVECDIVWNHAVPYAYWHYDPEPGTFNGRSLEIDPLADDLAEKLQTAKEWDDADRAYYEKLRAEREENKVEA